MRALVVGIIIGLGHNPWDFHGADGSLVAHEKSFLAVKPLGFGRDFVGYSGFSPP
jgi:hypothetical protein